ncbi:Exclusion suppressor FxsA [Planctomycetales bacterium 10988]|nr:Exclusion suppressor FxsA [Planctomycetales bacterium 10988]
MFIRLFLLLTFMPLIELTLLLWLSSVTSWQITLAIVLITGFLGALLARSEGLSAVRRIQMESAQGKVPSGAIVDGVLILIAGILLVTPGILTDVIGFSLLIPPIRELYKRSVVANLKKNVKVQTVKITQMGQERTEQRWSSSPNTSSDRVLEGEVIHKEVHPRQD